MQMCKPHWDRLRKAIDDRGLTPLIAQDGKAAADSVMRQLRGTDDKSDFDPLMGANWAIMAAAIEDVGLQAMVGEFCPLCSVEKQSAELCEEWIDGASDDQLAIARHLGLTPAAQ